MTVRQFVSPKAKLPEKIAPKKKGQYVYILECSDRTLYTGWTTNLDERLKAHNGERRGGAKCTRGRRPVRLVYFESCDTKSGAMSREALIKKLTHAEKLALICKTSDFCAEGKMGKGRKNSTGDSIKSGTEKKTESGRKNP